MSIPDTSDETSLRTIYFLDKTNEIASSPTPVDTTDKSIEKPIKTVSHTRRVHFPVEDSQLRIISYAPEPLSGQPLVSLGVILQRYRATCQRLQLRPIVALLDQLNSIDDGRHCFYDRLDCLQIINEKLDVKHIDSIEEILSRCRFHTLDLDSTFLDDSALGQLLDVIEYYESCTHLNLSNNRSIAFQGYQALTKYLRRTSSLERLDMNSMRFDDTNVIYFTRSLRLSSTLYELHVESCQLNGKILQKFVQNLRSCTSLRELYLCDNRLQVQDSVQINELIRTCGQFLFLLDLRSNSLQDAGMSHLASQFSQYDEHHTNENSLHKLSLQSNQLTQQGVGFLAKSLLHNRTLRSLDLSNNNITNEGLFLLRDALLTNRTINELILRNCRLTDQAAIALAEFIAESSTIHYIDLRENNFQASGICGIAIAIKSNKSLLKLDFDSTVATPTYFNSSFTKNNIDRANNNNSFLSLSNLRRMTTGFSSFSSGPTSSSNAGGGGTRELLEQKAKWISDIAAVCQRNILIYKEELRLQEEAGRNGKINEDINQQESTVVKPEDIELKVTTPEANESTETISADNGNHSEDSSISTNGFSHSIDLSEQTNISIDENQTTDLPMHQDDNVEQETVSTINDSNQIDSATTHSNEIVLNDDNQEQIPDLSPPTCNPAEDFPDDDKRKIRHSDSIYLIRKKVKNKVDYSGIDEEESQSISSIDEQLASENTED